MAPLGLALLLMLLEQEAEADASFGRRREGVRGRHELRRRGGQGLGAHDGHLPLRGVVLGHAVEEAAGGAVLAVPARVVHARPPRRGRRLGVAEREAPAVGAGTARGGPDVVVVGVERVVAAVVPELVGGEGRLVVLVVAGAGAREAPGRAGLERAEHGRRRGRGLAGELGARGGDEGVEQVLRAEGEADELLVAVVLDE